MNFESYFVSFYIFLLTEGVINFFFPCCQQYFFVIKPIQGFIRNDIDNESRPSWEMHETDVRRRDLF